MSDELVFHVLMSPITFWLTYAALVWLVAKRIPRDGS